MSKIEDFIINKGKLIKYTGKDKVVVVPEDVKIINDAVFRCNDSIEELAFEGKIQEIGDLAFGHCHYLRKITLPKGIKVIGSNVLLATQIYNTESNWYNSLLYVDNYLFNFDGNNQTYISLKPNTELIASNVFNECCKLKQIYIYKGLKTICRNAFYKCSELKLIYFEGSKDEWKQIDKHTQWQFGCANLDVVCADGRI